MADPDRLLELVREERVNSWAALHNKFDNMYKYDNPELPTLQPWMNATFGDKSSRQLFVRNPYYHRIDSQGMQLPYIDVIEMTVVGGGLIAAKANAGEADLQARGLDFRDVSILKKGEADGVRLLAPISGPTARPARSRSIPTSTSTIRSGAR